MSQTKTQLKGFLEISNIPKCQPFLVEYEDLDNAIQCDVSGTGYINYHGNYDKDLEMEIQTNICNALKQYSEITNHDATEIGYNLTIKPSKKIHPKLKVLQCDVELTIVFQKPVNGASAYSLRPTIELISSTILAEAFILNPNG
jgi:hypothetical protein